MWAGRPGPEWSDGKILGLFEGIAKYCYTRLSVKQPQNITIRRLPVIADLVANLYGVHCAIRYRRIIYIKLSPLGGPRYTWRFLFTVLAHELAHVEGWNHCKKFRARMRKVSKLIREVVA